MSSPFPEMPELSKTNKNEIKTRHISDFHGALRGMWHLSSSIFVPNSTIFITLFQNALIFGHAANVEIYNAIFKHHTVLLSS